MKQLTPSAALLALALLAQCKKSDPNPLSQLPPVTQTGANTFGCLVNGQVWTPRGNAGFANYQVDFDPAYQGGTLGVHTYRYDASGTYFQSIKVGGINVSQTGRYIFGTSGCSAEFSDTGRSTACMEYSKYQQATCSGFLNVTRLDRAAGIVSGTFEFTLAKAGCDTIRVTDGRFDKKL